jgi:hypothetical protein
MFEDELILKIKKWKEENLKKKMVGINNVRYIIRCYDELIELYEIKLEKYKEPEDRNL